LNEQYIFLSAKQVLPLVWYPPAFQRHGAARDPRAGRGGSTCISAQKIEI